MIVNFNYHSGVMWSKSEVQNKFDYINLCLVEYFQGAVSFNFHSAGVKADCQLRKNTISFSPQSLRTPQLSDHSLSHEAHDLSSAIPNMHKDHILELIDVLLCDPDIGIAVLQQLTFRTRDQNSNRRLLTS